MPVSSAHTIAIPGESRTRETGAAAEGKGSPRDQGERRREGPETSTKGGCSFYFVRGLSQHRSSAASPGATPNQEETRGGDPRHWAKPGETKRETERRRDTSGAQYQKAIAKGERRNQEEEGKRVG
jgi:hypothetical protein